MNTPAHLLLGTAAFARPGQRRITAAAMIGALLPDLSLYLLVGTALAIGTSPAIVFGELYFSPEWQRIFAIDNSTILWGGLLALGLWRERPAITAFAGAGLLHLLCDLPLHHDDGRAHFWPLTDWVYASPISYWDSARHARWVAPVEATLAMAAALIVFRRFGSWGMRAVVIAVAMAELWIVRQ